MSDRCPVHASGQHDFNTDGFCGCNAFRAPAASPDAADRKDGIALIAQERARQIAVEDWTPAHDDEHRHAEMARAAACYALHGLPLTGKPRWPWARSWWKPKDRIRDLVRAGALIAAEIDRLQRTGATR